MLLFLILNYVQALSLSWVVHGYISKEFWRRITVLGLIISFILIIEGIGSSTIYASYYIYNGLLEITTQSLTFTSLIIITGIGLLCLPSNDISKYRPLSLVYSQDTNKEGVFILSTLLGGTLLSCCTDILTLLLGLELQSYSVYVLAASEKDFEPSEAAGLKYFLLGALSSALIYMGLILTYVYSGVTSINYNLYYHDNNSIIMYLGLILVLIGLFWKVAAAPLHAWSIDVYDAVPGRITSILSILPKIGLISLILRLVLELSKNVYYTFIIFAIIGISILSLLVGGTLGLFSPRIKRLLAYSSILNVGFIVMGCLLGSSMYSVSLYVIQYIITTMGLWLCLNNLNIEIVLTSQLQGLGSSLRKVFLGISLSILLLSTAGIPPMIGFFAKYEIIALAIEKGFILLATVAVIASLISTVYYLRVFRNIWMVHLDTEKEKDKEVQKYYYSLYSITLIVLFVILYFLQSMEIYTYLSL